MLMVMMTMMKMMTMVGGHDDDGGGDDDGGYDVGGYDDDDGDEAGGYDADDHEYDHDGPRSDFKCFLFFFWLQEKELIMLIRKLKMRNAIQTLRKASLMGLR